LFQFFFQPLYLFTIPLCPPHPFRLFLSQSFVFFYLLADDFDTITVLKLLFQSVKIFFSQYAQAHFLKYAIKEALIKNTNVSKIQHICFIFTPHTASCNKLAKY
jgi:hypothetical protein